MKVQLIHPPADPTATGQMIQGLFSPPSGLALLAKVLRSRVKNIQIEIFDGNNIDLANIIANLDADFVGVTDWYSQHHNALKILAAAKKLGATTIIGGSNVDHLAPRIMKNHDFIDYAVIGDGEEAMPMIVAKKENHLIPNLVYRQNHHLLTNKIKNTRLETIFDFDDVTDLKFDPQNPIPISSIRGCLKAEKYGRCSFCSMSHKLVAMNPKLVWKQVDLLYSKYGHEFFFETGDSLMIGNYPEQLLLARPNKLRKIRFRVYARPDDITEKSIKILKNLNVYEIFMGLESHDNNILKISGKRFTENDAERALNLIYRFGIPTTHVPAIYGLPGETLRSLEKTFQFLKTTTEIFPNSKIMANRAIPIFGSELFDWLRRDDRVRREYRGNLDEDDQFDYPALIDLQTKYRTEVTTEIIKSYIDKTRSIVKNPDKFGSFLA